MEIVFQYPPELFQLLVDTIPRLFRSKRDVVLFFQGAGLERGMYSDLEAHIFRDRDSITKFEIVRTVLTRMNEKGEPGLRERREVLRRVTEFEDFSTCWPSDALEAKGFVSEVRRVINVKDSFTRMNQEREKERQRQREAFEEKQKLRLSELEAREVAKKFLYELFGNQDAHERGVLLEHALNKIFACDGIAVRESFCRKGERGEGIVEQIDGVVAFDSDIYLVEAKWLGHAAGKGDVSNSLVGLYGRGGARGIVISESGFSAPAVTVCREALVSKVVILCTLEEIVRALEADLGMDELFRTKVRGAVIDKNPWVRMA